MSEDRSVIDEQETADLASADPNLAAGKGDYNHEDHIGEDADDDLGVAAAESRLDFGDE